MKIGAEKTVLFLQDDGIYINACAMRPYGILDVRGALTNPCSTSRSKPTAFALLFYEVRNAFAQFARQQRTGKFERGRHIC